MRYYGLQDAQRPASASCCVTSPHRRFAMLQLFSSLFALTVWVTLLLVPVRAGDQEKEVKALKQELPLHDCSKPDPGSRRHVDWINKLNGRRIVFAGDSPLRCGAEALMRIPSRFDCAVAPSGVFLWHIVPYLMSYGRLCASVVPHAWF